MRVAIVVVVTALAACSSSNPSPPVAVVDSGDGCRHFGDGGDPTTDQCCGPLSESSCNGFAPPLQSWTCIGEGYTTARAKGCTPARNSDGGTDLTVVCCPADW